MRVVFCGRHPGKSSRFRHFRRARRVLDNGGARGEHFSSMVTSELREIRFNYTSADDRQVVLLLLGAEGWAAVEALRARRVTGRLARLLMRVLGEIFIHRRNPFLFEELVQDSRRRRRLFAGLADDLDLIGRQAGGDPQVRDLLGRVRALLDGFRRETGSAGAERERVRRRLGAIVGAENVLSDPITLVAHATDATDWRLHLPAAVALPTETAQVQPLLAAIAALGLHAIPRGAGTGLTGGAVPLRPGCVVVNTERLDRILGVEERPFRLADGREVRAQVMALEAGVVTERAMEAAAARGLVFATDPTSAWACTIGGNIAENAGGKTAVRYGTCIDNLLAWTIAMPRGTFTVRRLDHPLRKILPGDTVRWRVEGADGAAVRTIALDAGEIRRAGLWKDITNKALGGVPGLQKEGTDGVIVTAEFLLHPRYEATATLCLEFFGDDMDEASQVILELVRAFPDAGAEALQSLEHFDGQYVRAIDYRVKAARPGTPKAVLLVDVVGHDGSQIRRAVATVRGLLARRENTELAVARDAAEAARFWADRKRLGAIAARTNAFKLNEDIVLPLEALAEFSRWVDAVNLEEERENQAELARRLRDFFDEAPGQEDPQWPTGKVGRALELCEEALEALSWEDAEQMRGGAAVEGLLAALRELVRGYPDLEAGIEGIAAHVRSRLVVLATHMHAGDGNVHVNIPVMSSDRAMLRRAEAAVDRLMDQTAALGGVCSGEHGIGVTKLKYLDPAQREALGAYRRGVDPGGLMNPGKLEDLAALELIFTPSFNLLELEARILRHGRLEELAVRIARCVRCGKCKPDCCVFYPARGLFYHPRNKNLAVGALVEALLYEAQSERGASFELLGNLEEVADHCTLCHKCLKPCPVGIDTGEVSVLERGILAAHGFKRTPLVTRATLAYLESTSAPVNRAFRAGVLGAGGAVQRLAARALRSLRRDGGAGRSSLFGSPLPPPDAVGLRELLPRCEPDQALLLEPEVAARASVFYFPGCGSERLYGTVGLAALHLLLERGARVVLPPPYLCCGFPAHANARTEMQGRIALRDAILFAQIREMFSHLAFDAVAVTCGTCREALGALETGRIFGCGVADAARVALDLGPPVALAGEYLYHAPCHDSLDGRAAALLNGAGARIVPVPHCCSEAGTLALSRPDIAGAMLHRKRAALEEALADSRAGQGAGAVLLTNCPSCLTGLGRNRDLGVEPRHVAVELARALSGPGWLEKLRERAATAQPVRF
jgi:FAD/FMN-containing dehydrogenase/Fe-S oxidoreductase